MTYSHARAWAAGPDRVYRRLAEAAIALLPDDLRGRIALDVGAGTGAASAALVARGARPFAMDLSLDMVRLAPGPAFVADAGHLPLRTSAVAVAVANLLLSHVDAPLAVLDELRRVTEPGGPVLVTAFPSGPAHPVKRIADRVLAEAGHTAPDWYARLKRDGERRAEQALRDRAETIRVEVDLSTLSTPELVGWRLGMAQVGAFLDGLGPAEHDRIRGRVHEEVAALATIPPLSLLVGQARGG